MYHTETDEEQSPISALTKASIKLGISLVCTLCRGSVECRVRQSYIYNGSGYERMVVLFFYHAYAYMEL